MINKSTCLGNLNKLPGKYSTYNLATIKFQRGFTPPMVRKRRASNTNNILRFLWFIFILYDVKIFSIFFKICYFVIIYADSGCSDYILPSTFYSPRLKRFCLYIAVVSQISIIICTLHFQCLVPLGRLEMCLISSTKFNK